MKGSAFENFNEEALEALDFARCQRPDGSYYGTGGVCRKGTSVGVKEKETKSGAGGSAKGDRNARIQKALGSAQKRIDKLTTRANAMKPGAQKDKVQSKIAKLRKTQSNLVKTRGREGTNVPSRTEGFGPGIRTSRFD